MSDEKRKCIFTNLPSDTKLVLASSRHSWTKSIPCTKQFLNSKKDTSLTDTEFKLVELFFQKELTLLKLDQIEKNMEDLRKKLEIKQTSKLEIQDLRIILNNEDFDQITKEIETPSEPNKEMKKTAKSFTNTEKEDTIKEVDKDFWK
jgi:hypothetical protein